MWDNNSLFLSFYVADEWDDWNEWNSRNESSLERGIKITNIDESIQNEIP